ncbi:dual specificity protein phosphatase 5 [Denticeps clupeoides]|uniref:dual specificity protein phosphatase 5 n=1 Tax=Denticeps clupeoides TaxID=299321 RepID=UPI0010A4C537|nr:dual specificity protein phosphatase 5 [Denticeps clupeoides]
MKVSSIDCRRLRKMIRKEGGGCLIVDCRPYFSFSSSSITGSLNVNLNSVVVRRSRGGPVPLRFVVPDERALCRLREGGISAAVVVDDGTPHLQKLKQDSVAQLAINTLSHSARGANVLFLKGGYEGFRCQYPELCTEMSSSGQTGPEAGKILCGHGEKVASHHKPDYEQGLPVELTPFLYLGSAHHASRQDFLTDLHITALLNVSRRDARPPKGQYDYKWIPVEDSHTANISSHFQEAIDFIDRVKGEGGKILVHCEAGISRSPTICIAYLMWSQRLRLEEAFDVIRQRRAIISPNFSFMGQLLQFEAEVLSSAPPAPTTPSYEREFALSKSFETPVFTFPTSLLTSLPIQTPVHQFKLSPIMAQP